jgi:hypothetical protein
MKLLIMQFSPISCHFISLRSKSSPQHSAQDKNFISELNYVIKHCTMTTYEGVEV